MGSSQVKEQAKECSTRNDVKNIDATMLQIDKIVSKFCDDNKDSLQKTFTQTNIQANAPNPKFKDSANQKMSTDDFIAGFTTSEHAVKLLSDASHEKFFKVHTDADTVAYTNLQNSKFQILYAIYMHRQEGKGTQQGFFEYVDKFFAENDSSTNTRGQVAVHTSLRFSLALLKEVKQVSTQLLENALNHLYDALCDAPAKSLYGLDVYAFQQDTTLDEARDFLVSLITVDGKQSIVELSLKTIVRLGVVRANPEDLLTACNLIYSMPSLKVDLRKEINSLPKKGATTKNAKDGQPSASLHERRGIISQNLLPMYYHDQTLSHLTDVDGWCTDGKSFYTTDDKLRKFHIPVDRNDTIYLEDINDEFDTSLSAKGQICYLNGKLYLRNPSKTDAMVLVFDALTLKYDKEATEAIKPSEVENEITMALMEKEDKKTGRKLSAGPFFTDGTYLYVVSQKKHIRQAEEDEDAPLLPTACVVEQYCPKEFKHLKSTILMKNEHEIYHDKKCPELDTYLASCTFITNGSYLIVSKGNKRTLFDLTTGIRVETQKQEGWCSLVIHDYINKKCFTFVKDGDYFSVTDFTVQALTQNKVTQETLVEVTDHLTPIDKIRETYLKGYQCQPKKNAIERKMQKVQAPVVKQEAEATNSGALVVAILLNEIQSHCDELNMLFKQQEGEKITSDNYLRFFHWPNATYITASLFEQIKDLLKHLRYLIDGPKTADNIAEQTTFSNVIKVLATNFRAMSYCGVKLPDILEQESYNSFVLEFKRSITYVIENGYSKEGSDIKTCGGLWEDLYAACQDIMTFSIQLVNSDPQAVVSNLASQLQDQSMSDKKAENCAFSLQFLSSASQVSKLFNIEAPSQLSELESIIQSLQSLQTQRLVEQINKLKLFEPLPIQQQPSLFSQACDSFERQIFEQLLIQIEDSNQLLQKKSDKTPAGKAKKQQTQIWFGLLCNLAARCFELLCHRQNTLLKLVLTHYQTALADKPKEFWTDETKSQLKVFQRQCCNLLTSSRQVHGLNTYITALSPLCGDQPQTCATVTNAAIPLVTTITQIQSFLQTVTKDDDTFDKQQFDQLTHLQRRLCFFIGSTSFTLIQIKSERLTSEQLKEETAPQKMARMLLDSKVLSGGIEQRHLHTFAQETKDKMKFYNTPIELLDHDGVTNNEDVLLSQVLTKGQNETIDLLIDLLQVQLEQPSSRCQYAKVGSDQGLQMSRVAFTVMLKFEHLIDTFEQCLQEVDQLDHSLGMKEMLADIKQDECFISLGQLWLQASKIRIWIVEKKNNLSEKIEKSERESYVKGKKEAVKEGDEEQEYKMTEEDKSEVQRLVFEKLDKELSDIFMKITQKAEYLLKMQVPPKMTQSDEQDAVLSQVPSYLAEEQEKQQKLQQEMNWIQRLKSWKETNQVKEVQTPNTSVLACLLSPISVQKIKQRVESHCLKASRRACGLSNIAQLLQLPLQQECTVDLANWFCASLRNRTNKLAHYIDDIESCGNYFQSLVKKQFFVILKSIILAINKSRTKEVVIRLLDAVQWKFMGRDHQDIVDCDLFNCLRQGDGSLKHPIRLAWGQKVGMMTWDLNEEATSLPFILIQTFDYLFLNIVSRIVNNNGDQIQLKKTGTAIPLIERSKSVISTTVSERLIGDAFHILFGELNRYCNMLQEFKGIDYIAFSTLFNRIKVNNLKTGSEDVIGDQFKDEFLFDIQKQIQEQDKKEENERKEKEEKEAKEKEEKEAKETEEKEASEATEEKPVDVAEVIVEEPQVEDDPDMPPLIENNPEESQDTKADPEPSQEPEQTAEEKEQQLKAEQLKKETDALDQIQTQVKEYELEQSKSLHQLYSSKYLKRLLRLLEVFTNVAQTQQAALVMIRRVANPYMLLILINLFTVAEPSNQVMVLKIIQALIKMGTPIEVFEAAIQSVKQPTKTKQVFTSEFLQFWQSQLYKIRHAMYTEHQVASKGSYEVSQEIARLITCIHQSGHYSDWSYQIKTSLTQQCLCLEQLNETERDILFCLMPGADFQRVSVGTQAVTDDNQLLTVLGYKKEDQFERTLFADEKQMLVGLYYNSQTKDQQEVVEVAPHTVKPLVSFEQLDSSVARQPEVIQKLVSLLESGDVQLQVQILKLISHLMKADFLAQLKELNLLQTILKHLFKPRAQQKTQVPRSWLESKITNMKVCASESLKSLLPSNHMKCKLLKQKQLVFTQQHNNTTFAQNVFLQSSINLHRTHDKTSYFVNFDQGIQPQVCKQWITFIDGPQLMQFSETAYRVMTASESVVTYGLDVKKFVVALAQKAKEYTDAEDKSGLVDWSLVFQTVVFVVKQSGYEQIVASQHQVPIQVQPEEESFESLKQELKEWGGVDIDTVMYQICTLPEQTIAAVRAALPQILQQVEQEKMQEEEILTRLEQDGNQAKLVAEQDKQLRLKQERNKKVQEVLPTAFKPQPVITASQVDTPILTNECEEYDILNSKRQHIEQIDKTVQAQFVANVQMEESVKQKSEQALCKLYLKSITSFDSDKLAQEYKSTFEQLLSEQVNQTIIQILNGSDLSIVASFILKEQRKQLSQFLKQSYNSAQLTFTSTGDKSSIKLVKQLLNKLFEFCLKSEYSDYILEFIKLDVIEPAIKTLKRLEAQPSGPISKLFNPEQDLHPSLLYFVIQLCMQHRVPCVIESSTFLPTMMQLALGMFVKFWVSSECTVPMKLLTVCQNIVFFCQEYLQQFLANGVIYKIINTALLTYFVKDIDYLAESYSEVQRLLLEVYLSVINLKDLAEKELGSKMETGIQLTSGVSLAKRALRIVREKQDFKLLKYLIHKNAQESKILTSQFGSNHPHFDVKIKAQFSLQEVERMKIKANDKCDFKPFTYLGIGQTGDGKNVKLYSQADFKGEGANVQFNSAHFFVYYPVKRQMVIGMGENKRNRLTDQAQCDVPYSIKATQDLNPVKISSSRNSTLLLTEEGELWFTGEKCSNDVSTFTQLKMPKSEVPQQIFCGRRCKFVIDKEGKTFFCGESQEFELPNNSNTAALKEFKLTSDEINPEKIVDIACGYHYNLFVTEKGKLWAAGRKFLKRVGLDSEAPIMVNLPQQADGPLTCLKVWASQRKDEQMALVMVKTAKGETQLWSAGKNESGLLGQGGKVKESKVFNKLFYDSSIQFVDASLFDDHAIAIDQFGKLWAWGNNQQGRAGLHQDFEYVYQPTKVQEFETMQLTAIKVSCGRNHSLVLAKDQNGVSRLYSIGRDEQNFKALGCTQQQAVECAIRKIPSLIDIDIADFSASTEYSTIIMQGEKLANDNLYEHKLPDGSVVSGILHVYQKDSKWHYMSEHEYSETKGKDLPDVCIALKYPVNNIDSFFNGSKSFIQSDLESLVTDSDLITTSSYSNQSIQGVVYTANTKIGGDDLKVNLSEQEFTKATTQFDVHPLVYYRLTKPLKEGARLPMIDLKLLYGQTNKFGFEFEVTPDLSYIENSRFLERTADQFKDYNDQVSRFPVDGDKELFQQMDKQLKVLEGQIELAGVSNFVLADMTFKDEKEDGKLAKVPVAVKQKRLELLWQYNYYFCQLQKYLVNKRNKGFKGQIVENTSAANIFSKVKHLILGAVKMNFVDRAIDRLPTGGESRAEINRNEALRFEESGKVDHTGEFTIFGQIFKSLNNNYECWKQNKPDDQALRIDFEGEASIDAGGPYREVLTNFVKELENGVLPLIVKTTNNKTNHGEYRDCYVVNPDSVTPTHQQMFKFLGVLLGYAFRSKSCMPFNMAPLFWKQLIGEPLTEHDLKSTDTYLWQTFQTLRKNAKMISDTKQFEAIVDQTFTVVVNGKEVSLCEGGHERMVNLENMEEFISLMCKKKFSEGQEQIKWIIEGMTLIIPKHVISIVQWSDVEDRVAGQKIVDVAKLKSITQYRNCDESNKVVKMFWAVMERMADEDKTAYLKFVWGRSRMPFDCSTLRYKHRIALIDYWDKEQLPESHTCFFAVDLPPYESEEVLEKKLLISIRFCGEIDND